MKTAKIRLPSLENCQPIASRIASKIQALRTALFKEEYTVKVKVYLAKESPFAQALHSATLTLASEVLACGMAKKLAWDKASKAIQLTVALTWREVKDTVRPAKIKGRPIPVVKGTEAGNLDLSYPEAGRETVRHPHEATRRECRLAQARKLAAKRASVAQAQ